jgi:hypothetical protein
MPIANMRIGLGVVVTLLFIQYELMNFNGIGNVLPPYNNYKASGDAIMQNAAKDEVVFVTDRAAEPQEVYYAQRNIKYVANDSEAIAFLQNRDIKSGSLFKLVTHANDSNRVLPVITNFVFDKKITRDTLALH